MPGCEYQHGYKMILPVYSMKTLSSGPFSRKIIYISNLANYLLMLPCLISEDLLSNSIASPFVVFKAIVISCAIIFFN